MNIFRDWENITSPILVNLFTAFVLFLVGLFFPPIRNFFFPNEIKEYPLFCIAEAYVKQPDHKLIVEFFIINRTEEILSRQRLIELLQDYNPDPSTPVSPDIELRFNQRQHGGKLGKPYLEEDFNDKKGDVRLDTQQLNVVNITIDKIVERAIMKVSIPIIDIPELAEVAEDIDRTTKVAIPFNYRDYEEGCYKR